MKIERLHPVAWAALSENAHLTVFGKKKPAEWDRIDYALLAVDECELPLGYVTVRETDPETVYWQFGGAFPGTKGTVTSWKTYQAFVEYTRTRYMRIHTLIENTNLPMLKMAMKVGFRIVGIRNARGSILVEHLLEFEKEDN